MLARLKTIEGYGQGDMLSLDGYDVVTIGRTHQNTIQVRERDVSRTHCRIERFGAVWRLVDAGSRNGTILNEEEAETAILKRGDKVKVGHTTFEIELLPGTPGTDGVQRESSSEETVDSSAMLPPDVTTTDSVSKARTVAAPARPGFSWLNPVVLFVLSFALTLAVGAAVMASRSTDEGEADFSEETSISAPE